MSRTEEITYLVPEINVTISQAWIALIQYCQEILPYGDLYIDINNGQPGKKWKEIPSIRFDKPPVIKEGINYIIQSLDMRIPKSWIDMIQWIQTYFNSGRFGFRLAYAQPTELLLAKQQVNFGKPETIPTGIPLSFTKT